jgi:hypothetical protein
VVLPAVELAETTIEVPGCEGRGKCVSAFMGLVPNIFITSESLPVVTLYGVTMLVAIGLRFTVS